MLTSAPGFGGRNSISGAFPSAPSPEDPAPEDPAPEAPAPEGPAPVPFATDEPPPGEDGPVCMPGGSGGEVPGLAEVAGPAPVDDGPVCMPAGRGTVPGKSGRAPGPAAPPMRGKDRSGVSRRVGCAKASPATLSEAAATIPSTSLAVNAWARPSRRGARGGRHSPPSVAACGSRSVEVIAKVTRPSRSRAWHRGLERRCR